MIYEIGNNLVFINMYIYTTKKLIVYTHVHDRYKGTLFLSLEKHLYKFRSKPIKSTMLPRHDDI